MIQQTEGTIFSLNHKIPRRHIHGNRAGISRRPCPHKKGSPHRHWRAFL